MADLFSSSLLEASFRGVAFPVADFRTQIALDVAQHKRPYRDGAYVEPMGRNPTMFSASIPFRAGLAKGATESWANLYPATHRAFLAAMADPSIGELVCPSLGAVMVAPTSCSSSVASDRRGGEDVSAEWVEAMPDEDSESIFSSSSPLSNAVAEASALDDELDKMTKTASIPAARKAEIQAIVRTMNPRGGASIFAAIQKIQAVFDTATLLTKRSFAIVDRMIYSLDSLHASIASLADPKLWDVKQRIRRLADALRRAKLLGLGATSDASLYIVPREMTVGSLASRLSTTVTVLLQLNPSLAQSPTAKKGDVVRYAKTVKLSAVNLGESFSPLANV